MDIFATSYLHKHTAVTKLFSLVAYTAGIVLFAWALGAPVFRGPDGFFAGLVCWPIAAGIALLVLGGGITSKARASAFWIALAIIGYASSLQLVEAGPALRYQHYVPIDRLTIGLNSAFLFVLGVQTLLVGWALSSRLAGIRAWFRENVAGWAIVTLGGMFILTSATVSPQLTRYAAELGFASLIQAVHLGTLVLVVWTLPNSTLTALNRYINTLLGSSTTNTSIRVDRFVIGTVLFVIGAAALLSVVSYERHPHVPDEISYLYQARYMASGMLTVPAPPVPEAFSFYLIPYAAERWYSIFPPGWPAMLALGVRAGVPWLVNPILAGLNILLAYIFLWEQYDRRTARLAVLLLCVSPWFVFMGMNFMAHTFTLTCFLIALLGIAWARRTGQMRWGWLSGIAVGTISLIRPLDGAIVAGLLGLWAIGLGGRRLRVSALVGLVAGTIIVGALVFPYNEQITGTPTTFPLVAYYNEYFGPSLNDLGFGPERGLGWSIDPFPGHSPPDALINANLNSFSINIELFGWGTGSLFLAALAAVTAKVQRRDTLMLAILVSVPLAYSLYWFSGGPDFGARYWYLIILPLVVLTVRATDALGGMLNSVVSYGHTRVVAGVAVLALTAIVTYFPWRAIDKYHNFRGMQADILTLAVEHDFGRSLILVQGDSADYQSAWIYNPLVPDDNAPLYAWDKNPDIRQQLLAAYPDRPIWIVVGPSVTRTDFHVLAGPLSSDTLSLRGDRWN